MMKKIPVIIFLLFVTAALYADVTLYLYPSIVTDKKTITLSSVALIDSSLKEKYEAGNIFIPESIFRDGYIDRLELLNYLKGEIKTPLSIFGSAVKVTFQNSKKKSHTAGS